MCGGAGVCGAHGADDAQNSEHAQDRREIGGGARQQHIHLPYAASARGRLGEVGGRAREGRACNLTRISPSESETNVPSSVFQPSDQ